MSAHDTLPSLVVIEKAINSSLDELLLLGLPNLDDRLEALGGISTNQGERLLHEKYPRALMGFAIKDAAYIAVGARNALAAAGVGIPEIPTAIKESKASLLALGGLFEPNLRDLQRLWYSMRGGDMSAIPTQALVVSTVPAASVAFSESAMTDINRYVIPGRGCPARGKIMDRFFDRFVDAVLV